MKPSEPFGLGLFSKMTAPLLSGVDAARHLELLRTARPLVHCLTNEVVQEITANVLLAAGASPAMVVAEEEAGFFAGIAGGVLINIGTPYPSRLRAMHASADAARAAGRPWVLDPVAAGGIPWRDGIIREFVEKQPTVIRGNASEILALAGEKRPAARASTARTRPTQPSRVPCDSPAVRARSSSSRAKRTTSLTASVRYA